jgi:hypothetical protein
MRERSLTAHLALFLLTACGDSNDESARREIGDDFALSFSPMYSAFDGRHDFRLPVLALDGTAVSHWEVVDAEGRVQSDVADFNPIADDTAILTMRAAGDYIVLAHSGDSTGCAEIHIAHGTPAQWEEGATLYETHSKRSEEAVAALTARASEGEVVEVLAELWCSRCHDGSAEAWSEYFTPQSTGKYSEEQLIGAVTRGVWPVFSEPAAASPCKPYRWAHSMTVPPDVYAWAHTLDVTEDQRASLALYVRSLTPVIPH